MPKLNFYTQFDHSDPVIDFTGSESLARQEFRDEADINNIIKRYQATGVLVDPSIPRSRRPVFGDFSSAPSYQQAQDLVIRANEQFDALPVELRERFNYDPARLLAFLDDPKNREEAVKLGIIEAPAKPVSSAKEPSVAEPSKPAPTSSAASGTPPEQSARPIT